MPAEQAVEPAILRKNEWGFVGAIEGTWLTVEQKGGILSMVEWAKSTGVSVSRICVLLMISRRRVSRRRMKRNAGDDLRNGTPGPRHPLHRLLPEECRYRC
ncbi:MAG: hypothetical protein M0Q23_03275 [Syntrophales bacterium]|nr:hypothetical protein [Syntrophales bacterium]MCK9527667.1 hypothetical protein [Syntrophales bacterium]MDX9922285.1 hypothetical protein [Syntrophales bacterium]